MQIKKVIIATLFLLTYTIGFAHNLIPHCSAACGELPVAAHQETGHHHHAHHEHDHGEDSGHDHIEHNGHLDGGLLDYVVCLLSEMEHPATDCQIEVCLPASTANTVPEALSNVTCIALLYSVFELAEQDEPLQAGHSEAVTSYTAPPIAECPHRGPPTPSC